MNAPQIIEQAPLGAIIQYSNGEPKPPARFTRKLAAWEAENGSGKLTGKRHDTRPQFTLYAKYTSNGITIIEMFRTFGERERLTFTITRIPDPGSFLILYHDALQTEELLHIAESQTAAELWLTKHHVPGTIIQAAARILEPTR